MALLMSWATPAGELHHRLDPPGLVQLLLDPPPLGHVDERADGPPDPAVAVEQRRRRAEHIHGHAVGVDDAVAVVEHRFSAPADALHHQLLARNLLPIVAHHPERQVAGPGPGLGCVLAQGKLEDPRELAVAADVATVRVERDADADGDDREESLEVRVQPTDLGFGGPPAGDLPGPVLPARRIAADGRWDRNAARHPPGGERERGQEQ